MHSLENVSDDVAHFSKGCKYLLAALARHVQFSEAEKELISYYCHEIMTQTQTIRSEFEEKL